MIRLIFLPIWLRNSQFLSDLHAGDPSSYDILIKKKKVMKRNCTTSERLGPSLTWNLPIESIIDLYRLLNEHTCGNYTFVWLGLRY